MDIKEIKEREICGDVRVFNAIQEAKIHDKSFMGKENFLTILLKGGISYSQSEVREIWFKAIALGMQEGLRMGSLEGQRIEITNNIQNSRHKEFYENFLKLAQKYNCAIQYHPTEGMCVVDLNKEGF
jgi:hypothetical protein